MAKRKKRGGGWLLVLVLVLAIAVCGYILWKNGSLDSLINLFPYGSESSSDSSSGSGSDSSSDGSSDSSSDGSAPEIVTDELSIHFLELGNKYTGDCTLIKSGDTEILIDAGSRQSSAATFGAYLDEYCTDGVLEYVIATHADQDHIAGFVGTKSSGSYNGILYEYKVGTIIQFNLTNKSRTTASGNVSLYGNFCNAVEYAESQGTAVYTALDCWKEANGASRSFEIADDITMNILYNVFYEEKSSDENNYSVCMLLTQGSNHYLFTGDLEEKGEEELVKNNELPQCRLFKAGHHGSPTSSNDVLLSAIRPEIVVVSCCCGSDEYTDNIENMFPSQAFVDRVAKYTERVYVTTVVSDNEAGFEPMNGTVVITSDGGVPQVRCSNSDLVFWDTEWFRLHRQWPAAG